MPDREEIRLIEKCRGGDSAAFGILLKIYKKRLYTYLCRLSGDKVTAEDYMQETLIKVWHGLKKYDERRKFSSWLFAIAHNVFLDGYRKSSLRNNLSYRGEILNEISHSNPEVDVLAKETESIIKREVERLPLNQRRVFLLRQHGHLTFKEIAELTSEPLNTVLSHMHYAQKKLKKTLEELNAVPK